jgi:hypothetical protein
MFHGVCLIEDIEKLGSVIEVNPGLQTALRLADRQLANRFCAPRCFGADS